jgi:hypothetical protein
LRLRRLLTDTKLSDQCAVTVEVLLLKVRKVTTTLAYQAQQGLTAAVVFAVTLKVVAQLLDTEREQGDLALGRTCVGGSATEFGEDFFFLLLWHVYWHNEKAFNGSHGSGKAKFAAAKVRSFSQIVK